MYFWRPVFLPPVAFFELFWTPPTHNREPYDTLLSDTPTLRMSAVVSIERLGQGPMPTDSPFLFAVHHLDTYPAGNAKMAPAASLRGHNIGADFGHADGWSMYHGEEVPGFPKHPHRGFETVTIARRGYVDHTDSLGNCGRYGAGDLQWQTCGAGISHSEMFPVLRQDAENPLEFCYD